MARISEWFHRYAVAEVTGLVCALVAAIAVGRTAGPAAAAIAGTLGEGVGFYGVILLRDVRRHGATWRVARGLVVEFGLAEVGDTLAVRPLAMYGATVLAGDTLVGVLVGKVAADVVFYTVAIAGYELRKRLDARTALASAVADGRPAVATWAAGRPAVDGRLATAPASAGQVAVAPGVTGRADERPAATPVGATRIEGQPAVARPSRCGSTASRWSPADCTAARRSPGWSRSGRRTPARPTADGRPRAGSTATRRQPSGSPDRGPSRRSWPYLVPDRANR